MPVLEWQGWVVGDLLVAVDGIYTVTCNGLLSVTIDNTILAADIYHQNRSASIKLSRGKPLFFLFMFLFTCFMCYYSSLLFSLSLVLFIFFHTYGYFTGFHVVYAKLRAKVSTSLQCVFSLADSQSASQIHPVTLQPDIIDGRLFGDWTAIPIFNAGPR